MTERDLVIEPRKSKKEKALPRRALLVANPAEAEDAYRVFEPYCATKRSLYQSRIMVDTQHRLCVVGPALGAASAVLILEKLIVLGVKEVYLVSCCGSLDPSHSIGDVLVGTAGVSGEGVSRYYGGQEVCAPDRGTTEALMAHLRSRGMEPSSGVLWSTDAPYRERRSAMLPLQARYGVTGVDMEFTALCSVALFRGIRLGALFVVSDMIWTRRWKPGFGSAAFKTASRGLIERIVDYGLHMEFEESA